MSASDQSKYWKRTRRRIQLAWGGMGHAGMNIIAGEVWNGGCRKLRNTASAHKEHRRVLKDTEPDDHMPTQIE